MIKSLTVFTTAVAAIALLHLGFAPTAESWSFQDTIGKPAEGLYLSNNLWCEDHDYVKRLGFDYFLFPAHASTSRSNAAATINPSRQAWCEQNGWQLNQAKQAEYELWCMNNGWQRQTLSSAILDFLFGSANASVSRTGATSSANVLGHKKWCQRNGFTSVDNPGYPEKALTPTYRGSLVAPPAGYTAWYGSALSGNQHIFQLHPLVEIDNADIPAFDSNYFRFSARGNQTASPIPAYEMNGVYPNKPNFLFQNKEDPALCTNIGDLWAKVPEWDSVFKSVLVRSLFLRKTVDSPYPITTRCSDYFPKIYDNEAYTSYHLRSILPTYVADRYNNTDPRCLLITNDPASDKRICGGLPTGLNGTDR